MSASPQTAPRIALMFAPGFEEVEGIAVLDLLRRAGIEADTVAVARDVMITAAHGLRLLCDRTLGDKDFSFEPYDMIVLPGGMPGTTNLAACKPLCDELVARAEAGRPLAAICAAPTVFAGLGILKGRRACCYPGMEGMLVEGGAIACEDAVTVDGNLITSRGMGTAIAFGLAIVEKYCGADAAQALAKGIVHTQ